MKKIPSKILARILFIFSGIAATVWFLVRVIPKPSRATYPCMQAAAPVMSGFVVYLIGITGSIMFFKKTREKLREYKYLSALGFLSLTVLFYMLFAYKQTAPALAKTSVVTLPASPVGVAKGVNPGRVTWYYDNSATNENLNTSDKTNPYHLPANTNETIVANMLDKSILALIGTENLNTAWDSLFCYFNRNHEKGNSKYIKGEKIFIKINIVGQWGVNSNFDISSGNCNTSHTTPQIIKAMLRQLTEEAGVEQSDIAVGDPIQPMPKEYFDYLSAHYPNVKYICNRGGSGRTKAEKGTKRDIFYSDRGKILREGDPNSWANSQIGEVVEFDTLYKVIEDADYLINISGFKGHERAGVSFCAKNHFGSHTRTYAKQLHMGLVHPNQKPDEYSRDTLKKYRVLVDLMGHKKLGGNTMLFVMDGLYSSTGAGDKVVKWKSAGFNNDWTSSIFTSQDHVAIEAVGLDFLKEEYRAEYQSKTTPQYTAVEDYLLQAADPAYWPDDIKYDPENDGTILKSLGVYETWNNVTDKQYSRNLGTGNGIELVKVHLLALDIKNNTLQDESITKIYPNPADERSVISFSIASSANVNIQFFDVSGKLISNRSLQISGSDQILLSDLLQMNSIENKTIICRISIKSANKTIVNSHTIQIR